MQTVSMTNMSITEQQGSWIASLSLLGALFGGLFAGVVIKYGRRKTLCYMTAPFAASWLLTIFATCVEMIYVTAFLVGFFSAIIQLATQANCWNALPL
jgi:facilitated trehalose transporter